MKDPSYCLVGGMFVISSIYMMFLKKIQRYLLSLIVYSMINKRNVIVK